MEGATTGSGIIAASLARETSCESQLESAELGRITLLASITEQNLTLHLFSLCLHYHFRHPLTKPSGQNLHIFILQCPSWEWKRLFLLLNGTVCHLRLAPFLS